MAVAVATGGGGHCGGSVGCAGGSQCHCSSFCNTLSILQNSNLAVFICLNMRFGMLLQGRNVKWKLYLVFINEGEKMLSVFVFMLVGILVVATWVVGIMYDDVCKFLDLAHNLPLKLCVGHVMIRHG